MLSFIAVVLVLFLIPGPAVLITISHTLKGGIKAGIVTGVGIAFGDLIHVLAAIFGLSAILMTSALAFEMVKYIGAAYLIYLGITSFIKRTRKTELPEAKVSKPGATFRQSLLIELLNPKTALFFLAFFPQFVKNNGTPVILQLIVLGLTFVLMSILYTSLIAIIVSFTTNKFKGRQTGAAWQNKLVGLIYIALGLRLALEGE